MRGQNLHYDIYIQNTSTVIIAVDHTDNAGERVLYNGIGHTASSVYVPSVLVRYQSLVPAEDYSDQI